MESVFVFQFKKIRKHFAVSILTNNTWACFDVEHSPVAVIVHLGSLLVLLGCKPLPIHYID